MHGRQVCLEEILSEDAAWSMQASAERLRREGYGEEYSASVESVETLVQDALRTCRGFEEHGRFRCDDSAQELAG